MRMPIIRSAVAMIALAACVPAVRAQGPLNSNIALQPSRGGLIVRQQLRLTVASVRSSMGELDIRQTTAATTLVYGLSDKITLILDTPTVLNRHIENTATHATDTDSGPADLRLLTKVRLYRDDFAPTDTARFDLIGGVKLPTGTEAFTSNSVDPIIGGVYSHFKGRNAIHADALWTFNTAGAPGGADRLKYDLAWVYRLAPTTYAAQRPTALFASIELNGIYETNNDHELFISPGIQYVTARWIVEATAQLPLEQHLANRPERDIVIGLGLRFQF